MKQRLSEACLPVTRSYRIKNLEEANELAETLGYPVVIKPIDFGGSGGVMKANNQKELQEAFSHSTQHLKNFCGGVDASATDFVIESYINSIHEISVEVMNSQTYRQVIGITDKYLGKEPYFSEIGHCVPSHIYENHTLTEQVSHLAIQACKALDIQVGIAHVEMKIDKNNKITILEVGARTAGDGIMDLYEKATGVNLYRLHCLSYIGKLEKHDLPSSFINTAAIGYFNLKKGFIEDIHPDALTLSNTSHIENIAIKTKVGEQCDSAKDWSTRYGFVEYLFWQHRGKQTFHLIEETQHITNTIFSVKSELAVC